MNELQESNRRILFNLLPAHVATHFLDNQFRSNMVIALPDFTIYSPLLDPCALPICCPVTQACITTRTSAESIE